MIMNQPIYKNRRVKRWILLLPTSLFSLSLVFLSLQCFNVSYGQCTSKAKYIIVMIADGWGEKQIEATSLYREAQPIYQTDTNWVEYYMSTFPEGGGYDAMMTWQVFKHALQLPITDSAASATAIFSGHKTKNRRISVSSDGLQRLLTIGEIAKSLGLSVGVISSVQVSHATSGAWIAHNDDRGNGYAIANEGFFEDPNTTGFSSEPLYGGGHGPTSPSAHVIIGSRGVGYIDSAILKKLQNENGQLGGYHLVERTSGLDGGVELMKVASNPTVLKLAGLFDHVYHRADGSGGDPENPSLPESTHAALKVLDRNQDGFVLLIEGGAVDWACHSNDMDKLIGEMIDFDNAVQTVINWVQDSSNSSDWGNTLLIVTGDHETGYLTAGPGLFPDVPLGDVTAATLFQEKIYSGSGGRRASWNDKDGDNVIDPDEEVNWAWGTGGHSNSLIPLYARGVGSELFANYAILQDEKRGRYLDNTDVFKVMSEVIEESTTTYYEDLDLDGFGNPSMSTDACTQPVGFIKDNTDCNDNVASINSEAFEVFDGVDNNCDGMVDEGFTDADRDGYAAELDDCNDTQGSINPGVREAFDGVDNNCDGVVDEDFTDADGDRYAAELDDCDDTNPNIYPGATEIPDNGIDEDCNGTDVKSVIETVTKIQTITEKLNLLEREVSSKKKERGKLAKQLKSWRKKSHKQKNLKVAKRQVKKLYDRIGSFDRKITSLQKEQKRLTRSLESKIKKIRKTKNKKEKSFYYLSKKHHEKLIKILNKWDKGVSKRLQEWMKDYNRKGKKREKGREKDDDDKD